MVAANLAERVTVQLSYAIGSTQPVSVAVTSHGTGKVADAVLSAGLRRVFDLSPKAIIDDLNLRRPFFSETAAYGHFGRSGQAFSWEETPRIDELINAVDSL